jgi:hypothetical protein
LWRRVGTCLQISSRIRSARIAADHLSQLTSTLASIISIPAGKRVFPYMAGSKAKDAGGNPDCRPGW